MSEFIVQWLGNFFFGLKCRGNWQHFLKCTLFEKDLFLTGISLVDSTGDVEEERKSELAVTKGIEYAYAVARPQEENVETEREQVSAANQLVLWVVRVLVCKKTKCCALMFKVKAFHI